MAAVLGRSLYTICIIPFVASVLIGSVATPSRAEAGERPEIGFYSWTLQRNNLYVSGYVPRIPARYEYGGSPIWYAGGWAPDVMDVALDAGSRWRRVRDILRVHVDLRMKVSPLKIDPVTGLTDFVAMGRSARWLLVLRKRILLKGLDHDQRIHLVSGLAFGRMLYEMWQRDQWPLELRAEVRVSRFGRGQAATTVTGRLGIIPGE